MYRDVPTYVLGNRINIYHMTLMSTVFLYLGYFAVVEPGTPRSAVRISCTLLESTDSGEITHSLSSFLQICSRVSPSDILPRHISSSPSCGMYWRSRDKKSAGSLLTPAKCREIMQILYVQQNRVKILAIASAAALSLAVLPFISHATAAVLSHSRKTTVPLNVSAQSMT